MAAIRIQTIRGAKESNRLTRGDSARQVLDSLFLIPHFGTISAAKLRPSRWRPTLAVKVGGQRPARPEGGAPVVSRLIDLSHAARPVSANQQASAVGRFGCLIPPLGTDHGCPFPPRSHAAGRGSGMTV